MIRAPAALLLAAASVSAGEATVTADRLEGDAAAETVVFTGSATLLYDDLHLTADLIDYSAATRRARARGQVRAVQGARLLEADALSLDLGDGALVVQRPVLRLGGAVPVRIWGERMERDAAGDYLGAHLSLTPCDCPEEPVPCWQIDADAARVVPEDRAELEVPVLRVFGVPVFALPALSVPLAARRSGLLLPRLVAWSPSGFVYEQPLFLTLGDAFDATVTAGWATGSGGAPPPGSRGVKGPSAGLELRWAPAERVEGRAALDWRYDLYAGRGHRGVLDLRHRHSVGGVRFNADLLAASDREWFRDTAADLAGRARAYARSTALFEAAGESYGVSAEATILQDLRAAAPTPFQAPRAGEVALRIPVARILGPLRAGGQATLSAARQTGALRLDAPLDLADVAVVIPEFALRGALYDGRTLRRVTWLGATLRTELGRRFGEWNHLIVPEVRWRLGWAGADPGVPDPRDELDAALPPGGIHQLDARVVSDLSGPGLSLRAEAGQGVHLALPGVPARAAEGWLAASADWIWGRADGELRGDGQALRLAVARAALTLRDPRGDEWRGTAFYVAPGASDRARAPLDSLFALSAPTVAPPVTQLAAGATAVIANGLSARYDLLWVPGGQLQHAAAIRYDSPCGCAAASLTLNWISGESVPRLGVLLDLKQLGSIGAGG